MSEQIHQFLISARNLQCVSVFLCNPYLQLLFFLKCYLYVVRTMNIFIFNLLVFCQFVDVILSCRALKSVKIKTKLYKARTKDLRYMSALNGAQKLKENVRRDNLETNKK